VRTQITDGSGRGFSPARKRIAWTFGPFIDWVNERLAPRGEGYNLPQAERFKAALRIPVITVGGFRSREAMEAAVAGNRTDAVSCARAMVADPYLFRHLYQPDTTAPLCGFCNDCIARLGVHPVNCYSPELRQRRAAMLSRGLAAHPDTSKELS
jgi:2,4-dienoyl-CoA reductase-like NADH-dependent reductase (Old Yellow Enzyme family)